MSRGALALLLVLALFVCDGAFGAVLHRLTPSVDAGEAPVGTPLLAEGYALQAAHAWGDAATAAEGAPSRVAAFLFPYLLLSHSGDGEAVDATASIANHVGALLFVLSAVFLSWLRDISRRRETLLPRLLFSRLCPPHGVGLASRPTIPALQAFRL